MTLYTIIRQFMKSLVSTCILVILSFTLPTIAQESTPDETIELAADTLIYNQETGDVTAEGNVYISRNGYTLRADRVDYSEVTGVVKALGKVEITDPNGNILLLDEAELDKDLRNGFVLNIRFVLYDGSRLAAQDGVRQFGNKTILNYAAYTPCMIICKEGKPQRPSWQIKAVKVTHDQEKRRLYYKDAYLELFGVPVLYTPYFSHPDPSVNRATGLLVPEFRQSQHLGFVYEQPFFIRLTDTSDMTLTPIITTDVGVAMGAQYRKHFGSARIQFDGSGTYVDERDANNLKTGDSEFRGHLFSEGLFSHGNSWRSRYQLQVASDDTYLRRYGFSQADTLTSQWLSEGFYGRSYASVRALWFQGLRVEDIQGLTGFALPLATFSYVSKPDDIGGVIRSETNTLALHRTDGLDQQRISTTASYEIPYINQLGQQFRLSANLRADLYNVGDATKPDQPVFAGENGTTGRFLPHATLSFRWPFIKAGQQQTQVLEPILDLIVAREGGNPDAIANEDSRVFELTDTNIFSDNRFVGLDRWEGGSRINYGMKWSLQQSGFRTEVLLGQSYRFESNRQIFPDGTGLEGNFSDFVGRVDVGIGRYVDLAYRFRLDKDNLAVRRNEIDTTVGTDKARITAGYYQLNRNREIEGIEDREELRATGRFRLRDNWEFFGNATQNLTDGRSPIAHGLGLLYTNDCLELSLSWRRSFTRDRDFVPGTSVLFRIRLRNLGGFTSDGSPANRNGTPQSC